MSEKHLNQEKDIMEVLFNMPQSVSFVFQIQGEDKNIYYMKLGDPVFTPNDTEYVSAVPVMGYSDMSGNLWFDDQFFIPRGKELIAIKNVNLLDMLIATAKVVRKSPSIYEPKTVKNFKALGLIG